MRALAVSAGLAAVALLIWPPLLFVVALGVTWWATHQARHLIQAGAEDPAPPQEGAEQSVLSPQ